MPLPILTDEEFRPISKPPEDSGFGALKTEKGNLPLRVIEVHSRISGLSAEVVLRQTFLNTHPVPLEATYIFPLPDRAAVTGFRFEVANRRIDGVLKERGAAREEYDQAIASGHRAAIAEEERPGTFSMRVGNLLPNEAATVQFTMTMPLLYSDGEATFRFPLVVAPRYIPGAALGGGQVGDGVAQDTDAVPDASRISPPVLLPGFPNPVRLGIEVEIDSSALPISQLKSSLHSIVEELSSKGRRVRVQPGERLDRDFVLRFQVGENNVQSGLLVKSDVEGGGTFALTVVPPVNLSKQQKPRDVVFVLDRSGSMGGWKMVSARRAVARMVDTLTERDRFTVYAFDDAIEAPSAFGGMDLAPANDRNRFKAVEFLAKVDSRGGTEMAQPLSLAVDLLNKASSGPERDRVLVLATDGQVGNEDQILRQLAPRLGSLRIFTVGIDTAVNEGFLKRMAAQGGGTFELVESEDRLDEVMDKIHRRVGNPVLTGLRLEPTGMEVLADSVSPNRLPDLFVGAPIVISGRYRGTAGSLTLRGVDMAGQSWSTQLSPEPTTNGAVAAQYARTHLRDLEDRYAITATSELEAKIVATSLRFGVMCRFTSFVAVDRTEVVNKGGPLHKQTQAVETPDGWDMFGKKGNEARTLAGGIGNRRAVGPGAPAPARAQAQASASAHDDASDAPMAAMDEMSQEKNAPDAGASTSMADLSQLLRAKAGESAPEAKVAIAAPAEYAKDSARGGSGGVSAGKPAAPPAMSSAPTKKAPMPSKTMAPPQPPAQAPVPPPAPASASRSSSTKGPASQKQHRSRGLMSGFFKSEEKEREDQNQGWVALDLAPYRARAREMLEKLPKPGDGQVPLLALGTLIVKLSMLVEDLKSVGAPPAEVTPLQTLLNELTAARDRATGSGADVGPFQVTAERVLRTFVESGKGPTPSPSSNEPRKRGFWK